MLFLSMHFVYEVEMLIEFESDTAMEIILNTHSSYQ